jgi:hypothetical protein
LIAGTGFFYINSYLFLIQAIELVENFIFCFITSIIWKEMSLVSQAIAGIKATQQQHKQCEKRQHCCRKSKSCVVVSPSRSPSSAAAAVSTSINVAGEVPRPLTDLDSPTGKA